MTLPIQIEGETTLKEEVCCDGCQVLMADADVFFRDGLTNTNPEDIKPENIRNYCKTCVDGSCLLTEKSNHMIRWFVWLAIKDSPKEHRQEMKKELEAERGTELMTLIDDLFEIDSFYKINEIKETTDTIVA